MRFERTAIHDVFIVHIEPHGDERGFFSRLWCAAEFAEMGITTTVNQVSMSHTRDAGTVRGLHLQRAPNHEAKLVRCIAGAIVDVAVDVRPESESYLSHVAVELSASNHVALAIPAYLAHGFQTLTPDAEVMYQMDGPYAPEAELGYRFDDPAFGIEWPLEVTDLSAKDQAWPPFAG